MTSTNLAIIDNLVPEAPAGQTFDQVAQNLWEGQDHYGTQPIQHLAVYEVGYDGPPDCTARMLFTLAERTHRERMVPGHLATVLWQSGLDVFVPEEDRGPDPDWQHDLEMEQAA